jgi:Mg2+ and Co2+ transporter CorA
MSIDEVQIEMESLSEFQKLYDDYMKSSHKDYPELHRRAMIYKRNLLLHPKDDHSDLKHVSQFITELAHYHTTLSIIDLKQRMFVLSMLACIVGPTSFVGAIFGINIQIPYATTVTIAYNPFFALCLFCLWSSVIIGLYLYYGLTTRNIILSTLLTITSFTLIAMFLWVFDPIYNIGYQVGQT